MKGRNYANTINGKPVVNATRRVTLHISQQDVRAGEVQSPDTCAAAICAMREIPNCTKVRIHLGRAYVYNQRKGHWLRYNTTESLRSEIVAFDRGGRFEPGSYDLRPLSPTDLLPKKKQIKKSQTGGKGLASSNQQKKPRSLNVTRGVRSRMSVSA